MENPEIEYTKHTIQSDISEKYIEEHLSSAAKVANHTGKTIKIIRERESDDLKPIEIIIKPDDSPADVIKKYQEEVKKSIPDGTAKDIKISSPERIHQQDI